MHSSIFLAIFDAGLLGRDLDDLCLVVFGEMQSPLRLPLPCHLCSPFRLGILKQEHLSDHQLVVVGYPAIELVVGEIDHLGFGSLGNPCLPLHVAGETRPSSTTAIFILNEGRTSW